MERTYAVLRDISPVTKGLLRGSVESLSTSISKISFMTHPWIVFNTPSDNNKNKGRSDIEIPTWLNAPNTGAIEKPIRPDKRSNRAYAMNRLPIYLVTP